MSEEQKLPSIRRGTVDMTVGSPTKCIIRFTLPLMLGNVFQLFYSWTDAIMLGNENFKGDPTMFSALSASLPIVNVMITLILGFMAGAAVVLGQMYGKEKFDSLKKGFSTLVITMLVLSVIIGISGFFLAKHLLRLIKVDESYIPYAETYLKYYFAGIIFMALYNTLSQVLRSIGNSSVPLISLIIGVSLNIVLDYLLVVVVDMGIEGVAIGTILAQMVSVAFMVVYILIRVPLLKVKARDFRFDKQTFSSMIKLAIPSTIQMICATVGFMVINGIVNSNGREFTTAFGLGNRIDEILNQVSNSFGIAISSFAAQNKGKGDNERIKKGYFSTMALMSGTIVILASLIYIFRFNLFDLFMSGDNYIGDMDKVYEIVNIFLSIYLPSFILLSTMIVTSNLIRGTGSAKLAMTINLFSLAIRVGSAFLLNHFFLYGVFVASPIGWLAGSAWAIAIFIQGKWKDTKSVVEFDTTLEKG